MDCRGCSIRPPARALRFSAGAGEVEVEAVLEALALLGLTGETGPAQSESEGKPADGEALEEAAPRGKEEEGPTDRSCRLFVAPGRSA